MENKASAHVPKGFGPLISRRSSRQRHGVAPRLEIGPIWPGTGMNDHAVLAECERGEDAAKAAYEAALQKSLPADVRTLVERQYQGVKANHDRVRNLRNAAT